MSNRLNSILVIYRNIPPCLYGAISKTGCDPNNLEWHPPFLMSKSNSVGEQDIYGTVMRTLQRLAGQMEKLAMFQSDAEQRLHNAGISSEAQAGLLPASSLSEAIITEQSDLFEEVLLITSIYVRTLSEQFPPKIEQFKVEVCDHDGKPATRLPLKEVGNLMAHNRYIAIHEGKIIDLMSEKKSMSGKPQTGLSVSFAEYVNCVSEFIESFTVKELVEKLLGIMQGLTATSDLGSIIFLVQNLYTLGSCAITATAPPAGPAKHILDSLAPVLYDQQRRMRGLPEGSPVTVRAEFSTPRFTFEGDLLNGDIKTNMTINGAKEALAMGYEQFFQIVIQASGDNRLYGGSPI